MRFSRIVFCSIILLVLILTMQNSQSLAYVTNTISIKMNKSVSDLNLPKVNLSDYNPPAVPAFGAKGLHILNVGPTYHDLFLKEYNTTGDWNNGTYYSTRSYYEPAYSAEILTLNKTGSYYDRKGNWTVELFASHHNDTYLFLQSTSYIYNTPPGTNLSIYIRDGRSLPEMRSRPWSEIYPTNYYYSHAAKYFGVLIKLGVNHSTSNLANVPVILSFVLNFTPAWPEDYALVLNLSYMFRDVDGGPMRYSDNHPPNVYTAYYNYTNRAGNDTGYFMGYENYNGDVNIQITAYDNASASVTSRLYHWHILAVNDYPELQSITSTPNYLQGGGLVEIDTINATDVDNSTLYFYCTDSSTDPPTSTNTICTGGVTSLPHGPYNFSCIFNAPFDTATHTVYCRLYDNEVYSSTRTTIYTTDSTPPPTLAVILVDNDSNAPYWDNHDDSLTTIVTNITESGMSCRYSNINQNYSSMPPANECATHPDNISCNISGLGEALSYAYYIACKDSAGNEQNTSETLLVNFGVDWTPPYTNISDFEGVFLPGHNITINEHDNLADAASVTTYECHDSSSCTPVNLVDNGTKISFFTRGQNYIRWYSIDEAGNVQSIKQQIITINSLPQITNIMITPSLPNTTSILNCTVQATDPDSQTITYYFEWFNNGTKISGQTSQTLNCAAVSGCDKHDNISCIATPFDGMENGTSASDYVIIQNSNPGLLSNIPNKTWPQRTNESINLSAYFNDPDKDHLNYTVSGNSNIRIYINNVSGIAVMEPVFPWYGSEYVIFHAFDNDGASASSNIVNLTVTQVFENYTVHFTKGWNLFGLPVVPSDSSGNNYNFSSISLLHKIKGNAIHDFSNGLYKHLNENFTIQPEKSYMVYVNTSKDIYIFGKPFISFSIPLKKGWNFINYPKNTSFSELYSLNNNITTLAAISSGRVIVSHYDNGNTIDYNVSRSQGVMVYCNGTGVISFTP